MPKKEKEVVTPETTEEQVVISSKEAAPAPDLLNAVMDRMDKLEKENLMLKELAGKSAIADYVDAHKDNSQKLAHLKRMDGKLVVGWRATKNFSDKINGHWVEDMRTELTFDDGSTKEVQQVEFTRVHDLVKCRILAIDRLNGKAKLETPDGRQIDLGVEFLNA